MITLKTFVILGSSANLTRKLHVLGELEDRDTLGVDGTQQRVFERLNHKSLRGFRVLEVSTRHLLGNGNRSSNLDMVLAPDAEMPSPSSKF